VSWWNRTFLNFTFVEWLVALAVLLIVARFIWAEEAAEFSDRLFDSAGLGGGAKYLITLPLGVWICYRQFKREQAIAVQDGKKVVRPWVLLVSAGLLVIAIAILLVSPLG